MPKGFLLRTGSPSKLKARTFRASFCFPADKKPRRSIPHLSSRRYRNPVILAQEWQQALDSGEYGTQADFARRQGISRARVTQMLHLLSLPPDTLNAIAALGDPLPSPILTERRLRSVMNLSAEEQEQTIRKILTGRCRIPKTFVWH
jgi:hypothetical protein